MKSMLSVKLYYLTEDSYLV